MWPRDTHSGEVPQVHDGVQDQVPPDVRDSGAPGHSVWRAAVRRLHGASCRGRCSWHRLHGPGHHQAERLLREPHQGARLQLRAGPVRSARLRLDQLLQQHDLPGRQGYQRHGLDCDPRVCARTGVQFASLRILPQPRWHASLSAYGRASTSSQRRHTLDMQPRRIRLERCIEPQKVRGPVSSRHHREVQRAGHQQLPLPRWDALHAARLHPESAGLPGAQVRLQVRSAARTKGGSGVL
mmetsp:Transcript_114549/g.334940  ORF Transcript_114549/g.334940 Transcript_114549/m.334940 type:complete len:239 (-) Transcript_114549:1239-1955(-)